MLRRSPLRAKRPTPRRNEGRVAHARTKPKATGKTQEQRQFHDWIASLGCLACGRPAEVHHILDAAPGKATRRDHWFVAPLCPDHHRGPLGVHSLGRERQFLARHSVDLVSWATEARERWGQPEHPFWQDSVTQCRNAAQSRREA
jgi:hypothetical protein